MPATVTLTTKNALTLTDYVVVSGPCPPKVFISFATVDGRCLFTNTANSNQLTVSNIAKAVPLYQSTLSKLPSRYCVIVCVLFRRFFYPVLALIRLHCCSCKKQFVGSYVWHSCIKSCCYMYRQISELNPLEIDHVRLAKWESASAVVFGVGSLIMPPSP